MMQSIKNARWIKPKKDYGDVCPIYKCQFETEKEIKSAIIEITAMGVYEAYINGERIGDFIMAPGWTSYDKRHQYQTYDITDKIKNTGLTVAFLVCSETRFSFNLSILPFRVLSLSV